eukprot:10443919-Alexandrium_andersonii.AAC.1
MTNPQDPKTSPQDHPPARSHPHQITRPAGRTCCGGPQAHRGSSRGGLRVCPCKLGCPHNNTWPSR